MLLKDQDKEPWEISVAIPDDLGKIHIRGVIGMNAKLQGPIEEGCGGSKRTQSFKKIDDKGCQRAWTRAG